MNRTIKQLGRKTVYETKWMRVYEDEVEFADGSKGIYSVVEKANFVMVVPFDGEKFVMVRQYRYVTDNMQWEFVAGSDHDNWGIDQEDLARAELETETGLKAGKMTKLGVLDAVTGFTPIKSSVYFASNLVEGEQNLEVGETGLEVGRFSKREVEEMIRNGEIVDGQSVSAWCLYLLRDKELM